MSAYLISHDLGTSGDKATLFSTEGSVVRSITIPYSAVYSKGKCAEQDPDIWWQAVCRSTRTILEDIPPASVLAVSFSAQMQGCILTDCEGKPLRPSLIWADQRAQTQTDFLEKEIGSDRAYAITGSRISACNSLEKVMWIRDNEPEIYRNAVFFLQAKDYINFRLTGQFGTDYSDASGTNLLDLDHLCWSDEMITVSGIRRSLLPDLYSSTDQIGVVTKEASTATGLAQGTPVICGGGDVPCSAVGVGCLKERNLFMSMGTSAWIAGTSSQKFLDYDKILFCFAHVIPGMYLPCGTMLSAGSSYAYIRRILAEGLSFEELDRLAEHAPAGSDGIIFLPYLVGEKSPRWDPDAKGAFLGVTMHTNQEDYIRAVLEGIAMNMEKILSVYRDYFEVHELTLTGGIAQGEIVCQILADVLNVKINIPNHVHSTTSIAAALIAGIGAGVYSDFHEIKRFIHTEKEYLPNAENREIYIRQTKLFEKCCQVLKGIL